ncbi:MAG: hypothetical protein ACMXYD_01055 [Candidatus Woesearchaeota archaeon]
MARTNTIIYVYDIDQQTRSVYGLLNAEQAILLEGKAHSSIDTLLEKNLFLNLQEEKTNQPPRSLAVRIDHNKISVASNKNLIYTGENNAFTIKTRSMNTNQQAFWSISIPRNNNKYLAQLRLKQAS